VGVPCWRRNERYIGNECSLENLYVLVLVRSRLFIIPSLRPSQHPTQPQTRTTLDALHHTHRTLAQSVFALPIFLSQHSPRHARMCDARPPDLASPRRVPALEFFDPPTHTTHRARQEIRKRANKGQRWEQEPYRQRTRTNDDGRRQRGYTRVE
jgi:hypothetical protein